MKKDTFDDDDEEDDKESKNRQSKRNSVPAELQSPKMIIEEQMDKVVTKIDPYHHQLTKNNLYTMEDGSAMLERVAPDAITTTTLAKERFIVRPVNGDIHALWMDVTHTLIEDIDGTNNVTSSSSSTSATNGDTENDKESILLDIAGYKTEQQKEDENKVKENDDHNTKSEEQNSSSSINNNDDDEKKSWGWGQSHANQEETVQLEVGRTYRIEMSLCGFSAFGYDEKGNSELFNKQQISYDAFVHNPSILNDPRLVFRYNQHYFAAARNNPLFTSLLVFKKPLEDKDTNNTNKVTDSRDTYSYGPGWRQWLSRSSLADSGPAVGKLKLDEEIPLVTSSTIIPETEETKSDKEEYSEQTTFTTTTKTTSVGWSPDHNDDDEDTPFFKKRKNYAKTLRLTSDQLKNLNLKKGVNTITFSVTSAYQGTATCAAKVFYWDYDIHVVISDIDGTITKSDTMGHLMTMIGKDWTHPGVAQLYTDIANNGYHFIYLTSRAIGQADYTRDYLRKVLQNNYQLPDGPVIMSPDRLFTSFHREVIMRKPEVFKMACLRDIQRLFGGRDPFYAGFGNRITDAISYRSVKVPSSRIFTIDSQGDVKLELLTGFKSSYIHLNDMVDQIFPPINKTVQEEFSDYNFWKAPMPEIDIPELEEEGPLPTSPKPKPIKPDPTSLPKESVVAYEPEPKRGLLRSFTSRSSNSTATTTTTTTTAIATATATSLQKKKKSPSTVPEQPPKKLSTSSSAPDLIIELEKSNKAVVTETEEDVNLASPRSLPDDYKPSDTQQPIASRSSSGIMSKVMGGVFSRKSSKLPTEVVNTTKEQNVAEGENKEKSVNIEEVKENEEEEEEDDDMFNSELDELDLDKIPFI
ncbi:Lipin/Ned1/Smp2-domain-containing protein [Cokeromyces recurvatus]|uniref:Lipin/Ned1/Smp2-domain-containing protein n=1 Tax=Cokeromyces recurvatus TaxID=90255 RepID=UPI00221F13AD|nr:Lipin/Ned1/Smp2-domain-containing protein [Cokeromyces recurvatus]KAI7904232.1 Lipin/Ned1/Smp2-domain-containing protein [Cokeromyces recurvatus]